MKRSIFLSESLFSFDLLLPANELFEVGPKEAKNDLKSDYKKGQKDNLTKLE